jgi:hypothetical protein
MTNTALLLALVPLALTLTLVYTPAVWVNLFMLADFYSPWVLFESPLYDQYHHFLVDRLPEREAMSLPELTPQEATRERLEEVSHGFTFPVVIRGMFADASGVESWADPQWWLDNYNQEEVLCGTFAQVMENCTIGRFFSELEAGHPFYISGASVIFDKHAELHDMIDNEGIRNAEPGPRTATQIFMGVPGMGSDMHAAIGVNIFRQVVGHKRWWFMPTSQTPYLKPSINVNGFSAHTHTMVGKMGEEVSPWFNKLERYTVDMHPGDVLINPPWFWHGILNLQSEGSEDSNELVIGAPSRYGGALSIVAALRSSPLLTVNSLLHLVRMYGRAALQPGFKINLQADIANNRRDRDRGSGVSQQSVAAAEAAAATVMENKALHPFDYA